MAETARDQYKRLQRALLKREDIDEVTRAEILQMGTTDDRFKGHHNPAQARLATSPTYKSIQDANRLFSQAKEGVDMKFKSRKATELMFKTMFDQGDSRRLRGGQMDFGSILRV